MVCRSDVGFDRHLRDQARWAALRCRAANLRSQCGWRAILPPQLLPRVRSGNAGLPVELLVLLSPSPRSVATAKLGDSSVNAARRLLEVIVPDAGNDATTAR